VSGLASLVCVTYRLVGMCSGARRIMSFLLGEKTYRIMSYLYVNMGSYKGNILRVSSSHVLTCSRCGLQQVWRLVSRASCCAGGCWEFVYYR
jgi:hypothetical protein